MQWLLLTCLLLLLGFLTNPRIVSIFWSRFCLVFYYWNFEFSLHWNMFIVFIPTSRRIVSIHLKSFTWKYLFFPLSNLIYFTSDFFRPYFSFAYSNACSIMVLLLVILHFLHFEFWPFCPLKLSLLLLSTVLAQNPPFNCIHWFLLVTPFLLFHYSLLFSVFSVFWLHSFVR